jgi:hypothetical protein
MPDLRFAAEDMNHVRELLDQSYGPIAGDANFELVAAEISARDGIFLLPGPGRVIVDHCLPPAGAAMAKPGGTPLPPVAA